MGTTITFLLFQIEKLPWDSGKANACGGGVRPAVATTALSNEAGKLTREGEKPHPSRRGEMSPTIPLVFSRDYAYTQQWDNLFD